MMFGNVLKQGALAFTFAAVLSACGGGDPSVPDNLPTVVEDDSVTISIEVIDPVTSASTIDLNPVVGNTINLSVLNGSSPAANAIINVSSSIGSISPAGGDVLTDSNGNTSVTITSEGLDQGTAGIITVNFDGTDETLSVRVGANGSVADNFSITSSVLDNNNAPTFTLDPDNGNVLTFNLQDGAVAAANQIISISSSLGSITPNGGQLLTDSNGNAQATLTSTGIDPSTAGTITFSFTNPSSNETISNTVNVRAGTPAGNTNNFNFSAISIENAPTLDPDDDTNNTLSIDLDGPGVENRLINVSTTVGRVVSNSGQLLTDANGLVNVDISATGVAEGSVGVITVSFTDAASGTTLTETFNAIVGASAANNNGFALALAVTDLTANGKLDPDNGNNIQATLTGPNANSQVITLTASAGTLPSGEQALTSSTTGIATASLLTTGLALDTVVTLTASFTDPVTGSVVSASINLEVDASIVSVDAFTFSTVAIENAPTLDPDNDTNNTLSIDLDGPSVANRLITVSTTVGRVVSNSGQLLTDANGLASVDISAVGVAADTVGVVTITFTDTASGVTLTETLNAIVGTSATGNNNFGITVVARDNTNTNDITELDPNNGNVVLITLTGPDAANQIVSVSTSIGTLNNNGQVLTGDANGAGAATASVELSSSNEVNGSSGTITVSFTDPDTGDVFTSQYNVTAAGGATGAILSLSVNLFDAREYALDSATASIVDRINIAQPGTVEVTITLDGNPVPNTIINTSTDLGSLSPASGQIITNVDGIATVNINADTAEPGAAGTITISSGENTSTVTFGVGSATLTLGRLDGLNVVEGELEISTTNLGATGSAAITVLVFDEDDESFTTPVNIEFNSDCIDSGLSTIDSPVTTTNGSATASYAANGCEGADIITATISDVPGPNANGTVTITASIPNSIAFDSATPTTIALQGTGGSGRLETADVLFQVFDDTGSAESGVVVNFALTTDIGGITLVDDSAQSNADGEVTAVVSAGNIPTPVRVIATISLDANGISVPDTNADGFSDTDGTTAVASTISTVSDVLVISTGLPDQNSFTIAASSTNPGGGDTIGVESTISVLAADTFNNPVPDGTAITFTTEFGSIAPSCTTTDGSCSVVWRSQNPRAHLTFAADDIQDVDCNSINGVTRNIPCRNDANFAAPNGAYSTIVAFALGEETFVDANGNGLFDTGEIFDDLPEVFLDHNDDGEFGNINTVGTCSPGCTLNEGDDEETFIDFNNDGIYDPADGIYNGSLCSDTAEANLACDKNLLNVSESLFVVLSSQTPFFGVYRGTALLNGNDGAAPVTVDVSLASDSLNIDISDHFNGPLPEGTTVAVSSSNCTIDSPTSFTFGSGDTNFLTIPLSLSEDESSTGDSGTVTIEVTTPSSNNLSGVVSQYFITCIDAN